MIRVVLALLVVAAFARPASAEEITDIVVDGNTKTTSDTVQLIARIDTGDDWKPELVDLVKQRLRSSGLFSEVEVFYETAPTGGIRVHLNVKDKHSWVIAPAFYNQPTNTGGGIGYGENNLFGENQKLLLYGQIATGDSFFVGAWVIPNIADTRFYAQLDTYLDSSRVIEYASSTGWFDNPGSVRQSRMNYLDAGVKLGYEFFRGIKLDTRLRAAHVSYSDVKNLADPSTPIVAPGKAGADISNEWMFTIDRRANWEGVYTGYRYVLDYEYAVKQLGSDFDYHREALSLYKGWQVLEHHNLVLKGNLNIGHHLPFQQELTTGGTSMRGWLNNQFRGDFQALANLEYSFPLFTIYGLSVRGMGFWDSAYTTFITTSPDRNYLPNYQFDDGRLGAGFKNSVGVGTRLLMRQIVIPLLGVDVGYGLEAHDYQVYLAIGLTD
ncbi:MAG TPA: BamA/TamA family outer membrane protein [Kofleriaceae bacterium]